MTFSYFDQIHTQSIYTQNFLIVHITKRTTILNGAYKQW